MAPGPAHARSPRPRPARAGTLACVLLATLWAPPARGQDPPPATDPAPPADPEALESPVLLNEVTVRYPPALLERDDPPAGLVRVAFVVGVDGVPMELEVEGGVDPELDAAVTAAVARLRYRPARYHGEPVEVRLAVEVELRPPPPPSTRDEETRAIDEEDAPTTPALAGRLVGSVREAARRTPLVAASLTVSPLLDPELPPRSGRRRGGEAELDANALALAVRTTTDAEGRFALDLPARLAAAPALRVRVDADGYHAAEWTEIPGGELEVAYFLEPDARASYRTVVRSDASREEVGRKQLSMAEVNQLPGNAGDALKALQTMPGVARPPFGVGLLVIRGAAPFNSAVYFAEHGLPLAFHFGALATAVNSDVLESVSFVPSNFDVRWGNATGGVVQMQPRAGRRDGVHGYVDADLYDAGALLEGPLGRGSYLLSVRRSYIDAILPAVVPEDSLRFTRAPRYWDYSAFLDHPLGDGDISLRVLGGDDQLGFVSPAPNATEVERRDQNGAAAFVHRGDISYRVRRGPWRFLVSPSFRWESADGVSGNSFDFAVQRQALTGRAQLERDLGRRASLELGVENLWMWYQIDARSDPFGGSAVPGGESLLPEGGGPLDQQVAQRSRDFSTTLAIYASTTLGLGTRVRVTPGVRVNHWGFPMYTARFDPRIRVAWDVGERTQLRGGVGRFTQTPVFQDLTPAFGNPELSPLDALHHSLELEQGFGAGTSLTISTFVNLLRDLPVPSERLELDSQGELRRPPLESRGRGRVYGAELLLKKELTRSLVGWLSYTLMRSERDDRDDAGWYPYEYDQTHILTAVAAVLLPKNWRLGGRLRLSSGNPTTPVIGARFDAQTGIYAPLNGPRNADRLPFFHQLDLRVDRSFYWRYLALDLYLDLQNAYNRPNVEFYAYGYDFRDRAPITGLPILPSLGAKLSF